VFTIINAKSDDRQVQLFFYQFSNMLPHYLLIHLLCFAVTIKVTGYINMIQNGQKFKIYIISFVPIHSQHTALN